MTSTTAGAASAPWPSTAACLPCPGGSTSRSFSSFGSGRCGLAPLDRLLAGAQLRRHRGIARQVDALEHRDHRRQRDEVDVAAAGHLLLAARASILHRQPLEPGHDRPAERVRHADADLEVARVGRLVAEHDQVVLAARGTVGLDDRQDRGRGGLRIPLRAVGGEQDAAVGPDRERLADLLLGLGRAQREHGHLAAVLLDQAHRLLHPALLVGADREAEMASLDRLLVLGEHHPAAGERHSLDADEDPHLRTGSSSSRDRTPVSSRRRPRLRGSARTCTRRRARCPPPPVREAGRRAGCACRSTDRPRRS